MMDPDSAHTTAFVTPVMEHWLEREIAQLVHPMNDRTETHRTMSEHSYQGATLIIIIIIIIIITLLEFNLYVVLFHVLYVTRSGNIKYGCMSCTLLYLFFKVVPLLAFCSG